MSTQPGPAAQPAGAPAPDTYLSVVIPVFNEEANIPALLNRLEAVAGTLARPTEWVLVDDGSTDRSVQLLREFRTSAAEVVVVELTRNFGQHAAVMAGFSKCRGQVVVTLDADLQNPPEEIPRLVERFEAGYDVVGTIRRDRDDPIPRKLASRIVNRLVARGTGQSISDYGCMLRAYSAEVVAGMVACPERRTFIPALAMSLARRATEIEVDHAARAAGESKYNLYKLLKLNLDLMMGFTSIPLRFVSGGRPAHRPTRDRVLYLPPGPPVHHRRRGGGRLHSLWGAVLLHGSADDGPRPRRRVPRPHVRRDPRPAALPDPRHHRQRGTPAMRVIVFGYHNIGYVCPPRAPAAGARGCRRGHP